MLFHTAFLPGIIFPGPRAWAEKLAKNLRNQIACGRFASIINLTCANSFAAKHLLSMAHSCTHIYVHLVFATKSRQPWILEDLRNDVERFMTGIYRNSGQILLQHYAMPDHYHSLFRLNTSKPLDDFIRVLKSAASKHVNDNLLPGNFAWQNGYGAFSHLAGELDMVTQYIRNQKEHHAKFSLLDEVGQLNARYQTEWSLAD